MRLSENGYDLERIISFSDSLLFDGKTKEKENLSANIEQIGVFVQGRTEERRKSSPSDKTTHGAMFFLCVHGFPASASL